jgi:hypothetical protein
VIKRLFTVDPMDREVKVVAVLNYLGTMLCRSEGIAPQFLTSVQDGEE